jgi:hypothetical protein
MIMAAPEPKSDEAGPPMDFDDEEDEDEAADRRADEKTEL